MREFFRESLTSEIEWLEQTVGVETKKPKYEEKKIKSGIEPTEILSHIDNLWIKTISRKNEYNPTKEFRNTNRENFGCFLETVKEPKRNVFLSSTNSTSKEIRFPSPPEKYPSEKILKLRNRTISPGPVSYTHLRAHETSLHLVCRLLLEKKKTNTNNT
eukprot:TRINITY_DN54735_c0_g1_i1.p1 TRINITY_DN54735_c0_g1~~TRINITY_DN54735_c0_g1_i1.p1  ORF type:complete len:159 (+),score=30.84 TRINITY_DN54735_c0_g1_i1:253-729(+)